MWQAKDESIIQHRLNRVLNPGPRGWQPSTRKPGPVLGTSYDVIMMWNKLVNKNEVYLPMSNV